MTSEERREKIEAMAAEYLARRLTAAEFLEQTESLIEAEEWELTASLNGLPPEATAAVSMAATEEYLAWKVANK